MPTGTTGDNGVGFDRLKGCLSAYNPLPAELSAMIDDFLIFMQMGMVIVVGKGFRQLGAGGGKLLGLGLRLALNMERCWRFNGNDLSECHWQSLRRVLVVTWCHRGHISFVWTWTQKQLMVHFPVVNHLRQMECFLCALWCPPTRS